jgi:transcriptional regulator with XRE-family HTH domain
LKGEHVKGALAERIETIRERGGINSREVAQLLETTPQTVSRWQTGRSSPHPRSLDRLLKLEWIAQLLSEFYTPEEAKLWLFSPHRQLDGARPADLISEDRMDEVLALIDQLQSGAYV